MSKSRRELGGKVNSDQCMASYMTTSSERMGGMEAGADEAAGVGAGVDGLLRMRCL